jgi:thiol-disulfide isomerase/thioredoxin
VNAAWLILAMAGMLAPDDGAKPPAELVGLDGEKVTLSAPEAGALVMVFLWSECPISNRYAPRLNELAAGWKMQPVRMVGLFVDPTRPDEELKRHAEEYGLMFPVARDKDVEIARGLRVEKVPCAVVIDGAGKVRYRGRIDDRFFALGRNRPAATTDDLKDAVGAVLAGKQPATVETEVIGCDLPLP